MFFNSARAQVSEDEKASLVWITTKQLATKGQFDERPVFIEQPSKSQTLEEVAAGIDSQANRLAVIDSREWMLLNGDDSRSRRDVNRMFGIGDDGLLVDNAASLVVAAVNSYRRRHATQAAENLIAWRLVLDRVGEDERAEVVPKIADADEELAKRVRASYRHYAYLTRRGEQLEVVFARFDDDKQTSLAGDDVWGALVAAGRAVGEFFDPVEKRRRRTALSEVYLATLLDGFDRHLTLRDVVSSFYKNPQFPLVPSLDEIRKAVFDLIQPEGHAGPGTGGWELVDGAGVRLMPGSPGQLAINSIQQQIRRARATPEFQERAESEAESLSVPDQQVVLRERQSEYQLPESGGQPRGASEGYSWYRLDLLNRSVTDNAKRDEVRRLLLWLASKLDDDSLDQQLVTLRYELNAATSDDLEADLRQRAAALDARCQVEAEG